VEVHAADFLAHPAAAMVSPANSFGIMRRPARIPSVGMIHEVHDKLRWAF
jgi:hypothetical protein